MGRDDSMIMYYKKKSVRTLALRMISVSVCIMAIVTADRHYRGAVVTLP